LLSIGVIVGGAIAFWPSGDDGKDAEPEASRATPAGPAKDNESDAAPPEREVETDERVERGSEAPTDQPPSIEDRDERPEVPAEIPKTVDLPEKKEAEGQRPGEARTPARKAQPTKKRQKPPGQPLAPANVTITVFPWGHIWINGKPWGRAPLKDESLPPGTYKISAGQGEPTQVKTVKLRAGRRVTVSFDLTQ
jgi:hypothetical protein